MGLTGSDDTADAMNSSSSDTSNDWTTTTSSDDVIAYSSTPEVEFERDRKFRNCATNATSLSSSCRESESGEYVMSAATCCCSTGLGSSKPEVELTADRNYLISSSSSDSEADVVEQSSPCI